MRRIMARHGVCHIILDHIASYSVVKICQVIRERFSFCTCHLPGTTSFNDGLFILGNDCCCSNVTFLIIYHNMFRMLLLPWSGLPESCASLARERSIASDGQVCKIMYILYILYKIYIKKLKCISLCLLGIRTKRWVMCCISCFQASARKALENVVEGDWEECRASPLVAFNSNMRCMEVSFEVASF